MKNPESPADNLLTAEDDALSLSCDAWRRVMEGLGEPRFRADQICNGYTDTRSLTTTR